MERDNNKWGTWEELLLGSAVKRHGTNNWNSVAMEVQARKLSPFAFSSQDCKVKYHFLQGRFNNTCSNSNGMPWLEELRKLRVAHLKRELQRYDDSIVSLESKLRRLKGEREQSCVKQEEDPCLGKADLQSGLQGKQDPPQPEVPCVEASLPTSSSIPLKSGVEGCAPASPLDSYYGSSETTAKDQPRRTKQDLPDSTDVQSERLVRPSGDGLQEGSAESREIGEDQVEEEAGKGISENGGNRKEGPLPRPCDSSDVLSSADYSTRRRRKGDGDGDGDGSSHEDEDEGEGENVEGQEKDSVGGSQWNEQQQQQKCSGESQCAETDEMSSMSQRSRREAKVPGKLLPLLECLRTISAHKFGSIFKHRLQSQGEAYRSMIRRHMDLGMVRSKLEEGSYSGSLEFFRDVLLVFNNALVYYSKSSQEFIAAYVLRELATKEMENIFQTEALLKQEGPSTRKREPRKGPELKPIIVCRKRSASGESHVDRPKSTQQSSTSALAATQMQQSESGKQVEMKDAEVDEIKAAKGKMEEGSKIPAQAPLNNTPDSKSQEKAPDAMVANSNSITANARQQSKSQHLAGGLNNNVMDTHNPDRAITKNTKKASKTDSRQGSSNNIHDLGEFVASNKISESAIRPKKSGSIKIEPSKIRSPIMETKIMGSSNRQDKKKDQELNMPHKQSLTANATIQVHSPLKRGVGRPPKHAQQKPPQQQQGEESELIVSKPRKKARR